MSSKVLDEFAGASGGALLSALVGGGDIALDRVLLETSSYYLLGGACRKRSRRPGPPAERR
jgi:hypothetical protein